MTIDRAPIVPSGAQRFDGTFFLGGRDLEMAEIASLLRECGVPHVDRSLAWGACLSAYERDIEDTVEAGGAAYAIELADDMPADWPARARLRFVDHHGELAGQGRPTSLDQILDLLRAPPALRTRWRQLVSANDRGHIAEMVALGASAEEIVAVRLADRRTQGVTEPDEDAAREAIARRHVRERLTRVDTDLRSSTAVADLICPQLGGPGHDRLLVVMPETLGVYADGPFIEALAFAMPDSWWGGALPERGFWGAHRTARVLAAVEAIEATTS